jgi:hypothetical protein
MWIVRVADRGFRRGLEVATGGTTFCVFRADARFPLPAPGAPNTSAAYPCDEVARGALALGPQRHSFTATTGSINRFDVATIF